MPPSDPAREVERARTWEDYIRSLQMRDRITVQAMSQLLEIFADEDVGRRLSDEAWDVLRDWHAQQWEHLLNPPQR